MQWKQAKYRKSSVGNRSSGKKLRFVYNGTQDSDKIVNQTKVVF